VVFFPSEAQHYSSIFLPPFFGIVTVNTVLPGLEISDTFPPCALTMVSTMDNPRPVLPEVRAREESPPRKSLKKASCVTLGEFLGLNLERGAWSIVNLAPTGLPRMSLPVYERVRWQGGSRPPDEGFGHPPRPSQPLPRPERPSRGQGLLHMHRERASRTIWARSTGFFSS